MSAICLSLSCGGNLTLTDFCPKIICEIPLDKLLRTRYILHNTITHLILEGDTMDYETHSLAGDILLFVVGIFFVVGMGFLFVDLLSTYIAFNSTR